MANLLDQRSAMALLRQDGWQLERGGKHVVKMVKPGSRPITLPRHRGKTYGKGLTGAIIKQAGLNPTKEKSWTSRSSYAKKGRDIGRRSASSRDASRQLEL